MSSWTEPARTVPRWWGSYPFRYGAGLALITAGVAATMLSSTYSLLFLLTGPVVHAIGWLVLPGAFWRRAAVLLPCELGGLALLAGPQFAGGFAVLLAGWLLTRHRPAVSYVALLLPIGAAVVFKYTLHDYSQNWVMLLAGAAVCAAGAWGARWLASVRVLSSQFSARSS